VNYNENLASDIWFGEANKRINLHECLRLIDEASTDTARALAIGEGLKAGQLSLKSNLISLLNSSNEENVLNYCVRLFSSTSSHSDIADEKNLLFLSYASQTTIETFVSCATDTMSVYVIPYLLTILYEWDGTSVGISIRDALDDYLGIYRELGEDCDTESIESICIQKMQSTNKNIYYYKGMPAFPGDLAKKLLQMAIVSLQTGNPIKTDVIPTLLSIWSGKRCPAEYSTVITDGIYKELLRYVDVLSHMQWIKGKKYFYGCEIQ